MVYDGGITLETRTCSLYGSADGEKVTTFTGTVSIRTDLPQFAEIHGVRFAGNGGTGLAATGSVQLYDCVFTGWNTGALARDGAWISAAGCSFLENGVGLQFDTGSSRLSAPVYQDNLFQGNGTGLLITALPGTEVLTFPGCSFSGNGTDIDNPAGHPLDTADAVFAD